MKNAQSPKSNTAPNQEMPSKAPTAPSVKIKMVEGTQGINKLIASIQKRGKCLDADIWNAGVSVLNHIRLHSDTTAADRLVDALPKGARRGALVEWLLAYGNIRKLDSTAEKELVDAGRYFIIDRAKTTMLDDAMVHPWYDFKKEPAVLEEFDAQVAVQSLIKRILSAQNKGITVANTDEALNEVTILLDMFKPKETA